MNVARRSPPRVPDVQDAPATSAAVNPPGRGFPRCWTVAGPGLTIGFQCTAPRALRAIDGDEGAAGVPGALRQHIGREPVVRAEGDGHLLDVELEHLQHQLDELVRGEVLAQAGDGGIVEVARPRHQCVGQRHGDAVRFRKPLGAWVQRVLNRVDVVLAVPGNCQADRQSGVALVVLGRPYPYDFGRDRIDTVEGDDQRLPSGDRPSEVVVHLRTGRQAWRAHDARSGRSRLTIR